MHVQLYLKQLNKIAYRPASPNLKDVIDCITVLIQEEYKEKVVELCEMMYSGGVMSDLESKTRSDVARAYTRLIKSFPLYKRDLNPVHNAIAGHLMACIDLLDDGKLSVSTEAWLADPNSLLGFM